jgi:hypothetical protein
VAQNKYSLIDRTVMQKRRSRVHGVAGARQESLRETACCEPFARGVFIIGGTPPMTPRLFEGSQTGEERHEEAYLSDSTFVDRGGF